MPGTVFLASSSLLCLFFPFPTSGEQKKRAGEEDKEGSGRDEKKTLTEAELALQLFELYKYL